jgi:HEAT repeat protein
VKVDRSAVAVAHLATAAGALLGGDAGAAVSDTMARVWGDWVDAARILQKAGYQDEAAVFFERCIQEFALPELKARCTVALAAQSPDRAFALVLGLVDGGGKNAVPDTEVTNMGLRLLGEMAGGEAVTKEQKDRAMEELMKRTKGFSNIEHKVAAAQGLVASRDPRAIEPLRAMTKGTFKDRDASRVATRGLFLVFKDAEATAALQKQLKGGFLSQAADQVDAAVTLIEGGDAAAFEFAGKFLSKKRKDEELDLAVELVHALGLKGGDESQRVLAQAYAAQKPKEWITAAIAVQLLGLGDETGMATVKAALANKDWTNLRLEAAVALGRRGDLSGLPVLKEMTEKPSLGGALKMFASGKGRPDPEYVKMEVAYALARIDKPEVVPMLVALLDDKSASVRSSAAEGLARMADASALEGCARALDVDYGTLDGRSVNPEQHAHVVRSAALRFPGDARLPALLQKASDSKAPTVRFLAVAEAQTLVR